MKGDSAAGDVPVVYSMPECVQMRRAAAGATLRAAQHRESRGGETVGWPPGIEAGAPSEWASVVSLHVVAQADGEAARCVYPSDVPCFADQHHPPRQTITLNKVRFWSIRPHL